MLADAVDGVAGVGTVVVPKDRRLPARKLWIAFALPAEGQVVIDPGAVAAITSGGRSLLAAGVVEVRGSFVGEDAVEICDPDGRVVAKGLCRVDAAALRTMAGRRSAELSEGEGEVVHRDDLVVLPG